MQGRPYRFCTSDTIISAQPGRGRSSVNVPFTHTTLLSSNQQPKHLICKTVLFDNQHSQWSVSTCSMFTSITWWPSMAQKIDVLIYYFAGRWQKICYLQGNTCKSFSFCTNCHNPLQFFLWTALTGLPCSHDPWPFTFDPISSSSIFCLLQLPKLP